MIRYKLYSGNRELKRGEGCSKVPFLITNKNY